VNKYDWKFGEKLYTVPNSHGEKDYCPVWVRGFNTDHEPICERVDRQPFHYRGVDRHVLDFPNDMLVREIPEIRHCVYSSGEFTAFTDETKQTLTICRRYRDDESPDGIAEAVFWQGSPAAFFDLHRAVAKLYTCVGGASPRSQTRF